MGSQTMAFSPGLARAGFPAGRLARPAILLTIVLLALTAGGPASALTGYRVSAALQNGRAVLTSKSSSSNARARSCDKGSPKTQSTEIVRKFSPVACEQPPKSELSLPGTISQASASAIATIG